MLILIIPHIQLVPLFLLYNLDFWNYGYSSGDPEIFSKFYNSLKKEELNINDLTDVFNQETRQTYIDSGHLNILGNNLVAKKIAKIISDF